MFELALIVVIITKYKTAQLITTDNTVAEQ